MARAREEYFQILQVAEQILRRSQGIDIGSRSLRSRLGQELGRVPQFLHRNAHVMKALRSI